MKVVARLGLRLIALAAVFLAPLAVVSGNTEILRVEQSAPADAALIFGALVRGGQISPLHAERLDTAVSLFNAGKVEKLVVSNAARAAAIMAEYLRDRGIPDNAIEIDPNALKTPHTCANEIEYQERRTVILISQRFHLPRIAYQCRKLGLTGQYVEANQPHDEISSARSPLKVMRIRTTRYLREAVLVWASLIGAYPEVPT
ncbi:MAG: YdcF family protein [Pseudomonadota bacterium]